MASLIYREDRNRKGWLLSFYTADKKKRSIWLGETSKRSANACEVQSSEAGEIRADRRRQSMYLGPFIDHYIALRTDIKQLTINQFNQVKSWSVAYFGDRKLLSAITQADFEQWLRWMTSKPSEAEIKSKTKIKPLSKSSELRALLEEALEAAPQKRKGRPCDTQPPRQ